MSTERQIIDQVRYKVGDFEEPRKFDKGYYEQAVAFAFSKLSFDFGESYASVEDVPPERVFLLVKLASIEIYFLLASHELESGMEDAEGGLDVRDLKVPDLEISTPDEDSSDRSEAYLNLAKALQREYDGEIAHIGGSSQAAIIETGYLNARSLRNGGLANRRLDKGLPPVVVGAVVHNRNVTLSWSVLYHPDFLAYEVLRSSDLFVTSEKLTAISDNHIHEYVDTNVPAGDYSYRIAVVNPNRIKNHGNTLEVQVI